jgi:hypothetical protein
MDVHKKERQEIELLEKELDKYDAMMNLTAGQREIYNELVAKVQELKGELPERPLTQPGIYGDFRHRPGGPFQLRVQRMTKAGRPFSEIGAGFIGKIRTQILSVPFLAAVIIRDLSGQV